MGKKAKNKSAAAKQAARASDLHELMPEAVMPKRKIDLAALIKRTAVETGASVRIEYRHGRGWLVAVGGNVIGDVDTDPVALIGDATSRMSKE